MTALANALLAALVIFALALLAVWGSVELCRHECAEAGLTCPCPDAIEPRFFWERP